METMLSIDFGNTYTKVGLRHDENTQSEPLQDPNLTYDLDNMCIPTIAACRMVDGKEEWLYGLEVLRAHGDEDVHVFRNWKPKFFEGVEEFLIGNPSVQLDSDSANSIWEDLTNDQLFNFLHSGQLTEHRSET